MGSFAQPSIKNVDTTNPNALPVTGADRDFLTRFLQDPQGFMNAYQNPLANQMNVQFQNGQGGNPEGQALSALAPFLQSMMGGGQTPSELQFGNKFTELSNPFGDLGAVNRAQQTLQAALPTFDRNLNKANASLMNAAPNRFSSRLAQEGTDLNSQALNDYNLFANQALMQGQQLQSQERNNVLNFMTGARGLQQGADQNAAQNQIAARGLYQQGQQNAAGNGLQAANTYGQLAQNAGNGLFNRQFQAGNYGLAQQQANINPILQILQGAFGFGQPQATTPIVQDSPLDQWLKRGAQAAQIGTAIFGGGAGGGK